MEPLTKPKILDVDGFKFICTNEWELWRARTLLTKEAGTIAWIRSNVVPNDVFYDIGACAGSYTMVAGREVGPEGQVVAFEPNLINVVHLFGNLSLNKYLDRVRVVTSALHDQEGFIKFYYSSQLPGTSGAQLGNRLTEDGKQFVPRAVEVKHCISIDRLLQLGVIRPPNVVKMDVDGNEFHILKGMVEALQQKDLRTIQVEIHPKDRLAIEAFLYGQGFEMHDRHYTEKGKERLAAGEKPLEIPHNAVYKRID